MPCPWLFETGMALSIVLWKLKELIFHICCLPGVSIDLVCLAEQPLHTVPLLKFFNKTLGHGDADLGDDYNIPHWMNHNFYSSPKKRNKMENSVPRIKIPDVVLSSLGKNGECERGEGTLVKRSFSCSYFLINLSSPILHIWNISLIVSHPQIPIKTPSFVPCVHLIHCVDSCLSLCKTCISC